MYEGKEGGIRSDLLCQLLTASSGNRMGIAQYPDTPRNLIDVTSFALKSKLAFPFAKWLEEESNSALQLQVDNDA
jgi:hypothetical protein